MTKNLLTSAFIILVAVGATRAQAQDLVLDDSLRGGSSGAIAGGSFGGDGWRVTGKNDSITWHIPTVSEGSLEFSVRGLRPNDARPEGLDKNEIFHMYDWTYGNADNVYDGYRNNPFKHFLRKTNTGDAPKTDSMEMVWSIQDDYSEPDTARLSWDPNVTYRFREEWGPDGTGRTFIRIFRDGALITSASAAGAWNPGGHAVRIAASTRANLYPDFGASVESVYSDLKVWRGTIAQPPQPPSGAPRFGIAGDKFTINGTPTFLIGVSYFDAIYWSTADLDQLAARRFNLIRIWLDWGTPGDGHSFFDGNGALVRRQTLIDLVRAAGARGIVVDVTVLDPGLSFSDRGRAVSEAAAAMKNEPNVFFDVMNEFDHPEGPLTAAQLAPLAQNVRNQKAGALLTVSGSGGTFVDDNGVDAARINEMLDVVHVDFMTPHLPRTGDWFDRTDQRVRRLKDYLAGRGRNVPVYLQEEARRGHSGLDPSAAQFIQAATEARDAGAAGWILHTDAGFAMNSASFFGAIDGVEREVVDGLANAVYGPGGPVPPAQGTTIFTGWEDGQPQTIGDRVQYSANVNGWNNTQSPPPECSRRANENAHSGTYSLMIAGYATSAYSYCYYKTSDTDIAVKNGTVIAYWIWHQGSGKVAIDGAFTDGSTIRDGGFTDQNGVRIHPALRNDALGVWQYVEVDLSAAAGKTLDYMMVGFDNGGNGFTGRYRAYIDDCSIGAPPVRGGSTVSLQSLDGHFVCAEDAGGREVNATRGSAGVWETFTLTDINGGALNHGDTVRFRANDNAHYITAYSDGRLDARSLNALTWESFTVERLKGAGEVITGDTVHLRSVHNLYMVAEGGGGGDVNANRTAAGSWEEFRIGTVAEPEAVPPAGNG